MNASEIEVLMDEEIETFVQEREVPAGSLAMVTEDFVTRVVSLTTLHKALQNLLAERVSILAMRTLFETLTEHVPMQSDLYELTTVMLLTLGQTITQQWFPGQGEIQVIGLDTRLERLLLKALQAAAGD